MLLACQVSASTPASELNWAWEPSWLKGWPPNWWISDHQIRWAGKVEETQNGFWTPADFISLRAASKPARSFGGSLIPAFCISFWL
jgi:hypothetical protein